MAGTTSTVIGRGFEVMFRGIKRVRPHRPLHPRGFRLEGTVRIHEHGAGSGIAWLDQPGEAPVTARVSRSAGTPDGLPDVVGLALRFHHPETGPGPSTSDVLLSSTGWTFPSRFLLIPRLSVSKAPLTTMMPYRGGAGPVLLGARTVVPGRLPLSLRGFQDALGVTPWTLKLFFAAPRGPWRQFGLLTLRLDPEGEERELRFDPILHPLPGARTYEWARQVREPSYALSRREPGDA
ncbi:hypothetical protein AC792_04530 [Arthrobacter sp. RIT-PI-e]|uniref:hypothetical protein n=1 Tax=Arthrobacter sp. RIT-PI-e TaxID=1681197 RepID=UPI000675FABF|nr:hypothetical protein [Arthrobacter sp. RIT-PI-e]KNC19661.1 hypothetical protein AC792_04530 [Arthrobacter sp. RIT-PI-e]